MSKPHFCNPEEVALKSFFLGPQAENSEWVMQETQEILERWFEWRRQLFPQDGQAISQKDLHLPEFVAKREQLTTDLSHLLNLFENEVPKFSPRYIGHMFSEIALPAFFGHLVALLHNPNNISGESSRVGIKIEDEAISALFEMLERRQNRALKGMGHFTSGGTVANFEALLRARARLALWLSAGMSQTLAKKAKLSLFESAHLGWDKFDELAPAQIETLSAYDFTQANPWEFSSQTEACFGTKFKGPVVLVPENKHYSWKKGIYLLGLGTEAFWPIQLDEYGKLLVSDLKSKIEKAQRESRPILMVVSVAGTTEMGLFDPISEVQELLDSYEKNLGLHIWHHVDAAYGGFFCALDLEKDPFLSADLRRDLKAISRANSVTLDPHKLGYVPYSCGAFLTKNPRDYLVKSFSAPYVQFDPAVDRGPFSLEGSRSATGAAATWMIAKSVGLGPEGYGRILSRTLRTTEELGRELKKADLPIQIVSQTGSNILCFALARLGEKLSVSNARTEKAYVELSAGKRPFFASKTRVNWDSYGKYLDRVTAEWGAERDVQELVLLRMCLMNPFFSSKEMEANFAQELVQKLRQIVE